MPLDVYVTSHQHSRVVGDAFAKSTGSKLRSVHALREGDCAFYGILRGTDRIIKRGAPFWYIDHGYINPGHYGGYYRVCRDSLHARLGAPDHSRLRRLGWEPEDRTTPPSSPVLVAPPSPHTAKFLGAESWVANVCAEIGRNTDRRIILTDKINAPGERLLKSVHCLVTLQSNLSVEAVRQGVPVFIANGNLPEGYWHPSQEFSQPLSEIERPVVPTRQERLDWAAKLAAVQYKLGEMDVGLKNKFGQGEK